MKEYENLQINYEKLERELEIFETRMDKMDKDELEQKKKKKKEEEENDDEYYEDELGIDKIQM